MFRDSRQKSQSEFTVHEPNNLLHLPGKKIKGYKNRLNNYSLYDNKENIT